MAGPLFLAACARSKSSSSATVLAAATIGPTGGEVAVTTGSQAGLRLVVPSGALQEAVELRILDVSVALPSTLSALQ
ncbi:MAG: hypothetical protein ABIP94_22690 [Planctomycetota bacterium]